MVLLDPSSAISRALATTSWPVAGRCLQAVDSYYGNPGSRMGDLGPLPGGAPNGNWQDAQQGYWGSAHKHPGDATDAPAGVPIYYSQMVGGDKAGHIVLSLGDGMCRTTGGTRVYTQSIASLNAERPSPNGGSSVLGWTEDYGNNPIAGISSTVSLNVTAFDNTTIAAPIEQDYSMLFLKDTDETYWLVSLATGNSIPITPMQTVDLLDRAINKHDTNFNRAEIALIQSAVRQCLTSAGSKVQ